MKKLRHGVQGQLVQSHQRVAEPELGLQCWAASCNLDVGVQVHKEFSAQQVLEKEEEEEGEGGSPGKGGGGPGVDTGK